MSSINKTTTMEWDTMTPNIVPTGLLKTLIQLVIYIFTLPTIMFKNIGLADDILPSQVDLSQEVRQEVSQEVHQEVHQELTDEITDEMDIINQDIIDQLCQNIREEIYIEVKQEIRNEEYHSIKAIIEQEMHQEVVDSLRITLAQELLKESVIRDLRKELTPKVTQDIIDKFNSSDEMRDIRIKAKALARLEFRTKQKEAFKARIELDLNNKALEAYNDAMWHHTNDLVLETAQAWGVYGWMSAGVDKDEWQDSTSHIVDQACEWHLNRTSSEC